MSDIIEEFLAEFLAQDTKEDGFATLVDSEGKPYVANLNPKERERYEETKKPLSKVKKEKGEEGKSKKNEGKKEPEAKKTEEKSAEKKPETEKKAETKTEKKIKVRVGNRDYEFTREEAEKQLKYDEK